MHDWTAVARIDVSDHRFERAVVEGIVLLERLGLLRLLEGWIKESCRRTLASRLSTRRPDEEGSSARSRSLKGSRMICSASSSWLLSSSFSTSERMGRP